MRYRSPSGSRIGRKLDIVDFDNNGRFDLAIDNPYADEGGTNSGAVYILLNETLEIIASDLPPGLELVECQQSTNSVNTQKIATCKIKGTPIEAGIFDIELTTTDSGTLSSSRILELIITDTNGGIPRAAPENVE